MKKPLIGLTPLVKLLNGNSRLWMLEDYVAAVRLGGGTPVILPLGTDGDEAARLCEDCDGFLFTGGQDLAPELYGDTPLTAANPPSPARDALEMPLLSAALARDKPILGICRGLQVLNVRLGGTLWQDLPSQTGRMVSHRCSERPLVPCHDVALAGPLRDLFGVETLPVNSLHHQGVRRLGEGLVPAARAADGLVEGAFLPGKRFVLGVQWHPEYLYQTDERQIALFAALARACRV